MDALQEARISLDSISPCIREISRRYPISVSGVFGSVARGTNEPESDVDVFAQFDEGHTFLDEERFREEISQATGADVDLVTTLAGATRSFKESLIKDMVVLYER